MRILLAHNSLYYPSHGGGDKSNRLLMEALAGRGHRVRVIARIEHFGPTGHQKLLADLAERGVEIDSTSDGVVRLHRGGVEIHTLTANPKLRAYFAAQVAEFDPEVIVTSTDDPAQMLFEIAVRVPRVRVVHLVRATIAVPFGWHSSWPDANRTENLKLADGVVGVSESVAGYCREEGGLDAIHVPISLMEPADYPELAGFDNKFICMVNPCAVKGISIFLALAERMPHLEFAGVRLWGTTEEDLAAMRALGNVTVLDPVDDIRELLARTRVMLVPSVWVEARSRMVLEAMLHGIPVVASNIGGIPEAKLGVPYLIPIKPVEHYLHAVSANMVPVADVPPQKIEPWLEALGRLTGDAKHYREISAWSRRAALDYVNSLSAEPFERYLEALLARPKKQPPPRPIAVTGLSEAKKKLLALRLKKLRGRLWFPHLAPLPDGGLRLFVFPHAGGGTSQYRKWAASLPERIAVCPVCLPGREARAVEPSFLSMPALVEAATTELAPHIGRPYALFGHSMGAGVAFEVARALRRRGLRGPQALIVSCARAPRFRLNLEPQPDPRDEDLIAELRQLGAIPADALANPDVLATILPALRADTKLYRNYRYEPGEPLEVPLFIYGAADDPRLPVDSLEPWREETRARAEVRVFSGGHFYLFDAQRRFLETMSADLVGAPGAQHF